MVIFKTYFQSLVFKCHGSVGFNVSYQFILVTSIDYSTKRKLNTIFQHLVSFTFSKSLVCCQIFSIWELPVSKKFVVKLFYWFNFSYKSLHSFIWGMVNQTLVMVMVITMVAPIAPYSNSQIPKNTFANTKYRLHLPQYQIPIWWWRKWLARLAPDLYSLATHYLPFPYQEPCMHSYIFWGRGIFPSGFLFSFSDNDLLKIMSVREWLPLRVIVTH